MENRVLNNVISLIHRANVFAPTFGENEYFINRAPSVLLAAYCRQIYPYFRSLKNLNYEIFVIKMSVSDLMRDTFAQVRAEAFSVCFGVFYRENCSNLILNIVM